MAGSSGGFGGGFGVFGEQQQSAGSSSFGAGFSFGAGPSQENNSGMCVCIYVSV